MLNVDSAKAAPVFSRNPHVTAAWIFGSAQEGRVRSDSDLDIAVLFDAPPSLDEWADLRADLQGALGFEEIDLVILNEASPTLRFEAVSGRRVYCRDEATAVAFASLTAREYEDELAFAERGLHARRAHDRGVPSAHTAPDAAACTPVRARR